MESLLFDNRKEDLSYHAVWFAGHNFRHSEEDLYLSLHPLEIPEQFAIQLLIAPPVQTLNNFHELFRGQIRLVRDDRS
jgi:hypothetical protein